MRKNFESFRISLGKVVHGSSIKWSGGFGKAGCV